MKKQRARFLPLWFLVLVFAAGIWQQAAGGRDFLLPIKSVLRQATAQNDAGTPAETSSEIFTVTKVSDGDTIKLSNGEKVRLIGIDTPESHPNQKLTKDIQKSGMSEKTILAMGQEAARFTTDFLLGKRVRLEFDVQKRDRYQRLLAYVFLEDGTFANAEIIRRGYATPLTIPPDVKYADLFQKLYAQARQERVGLWKGSSQTVSR